MNCATYLFIGASKGTNFKEKHRYKLIVHLGQYYNI